MRDRHPVSLAQISPFSSSNLTAPPKSISNCKAEKFASALSQVLGKPRVAAKRDFWIKHISVDPGFWLHDEPPLATVVPPSAPGSSLCTQGFKAWSAAASRSKFQQGSSFQHGLSWVPAFAHFSRVEVCSLPAQLRLILQRYALSHLARLSEGIFLQELNQQGEKKSPFAQRGCIKGLGGSREGELADLSPEPCRLPLFPT